MRQHTGALASLSTVIAFTFVLLCASQVSLAQQHTDHSADSQHSRHGMQQQHDQQDHTQHSGPAQAGTMHSGSCQHQMMNQSQNHAGGQCMHSADSDHQQMNQTEGAQHSPTAATPSAVGQSGFAAIQEVIQLLEADPTTEWANVDIDALREHLVDMDRVMRDAQLERTEISNGMRYRLSGDTATLSAIKRMVPAHAIQMRSEINWIISVAEEPAAVLLEITALDQTAVTKIRALGFAGFMAMGDHHQPHHLQMATGGSHQH